MSKKEKNSFVDKIMGPMDKISSPLIKFGQIPFIQGLQRGMVSSIGVTMVGSIFLVICLFGADGNITEKALLPFLTPYIDQLSLINSLSMNIMAIYMCVAMGAEYADIKGTNKTTGAVGALFAFILLNYNGIAATSEGVNALEITYWGSAGIVTAIIAMAISVNVIHLCYKYNIRIKLPSSVPPAISDSFSSIVPYLFVALICWSIRTIMGFDIPAVITNILLPVLSGADNIFVFCFAYFFASLCWVCGIHGDNIVGTVISPMLQTWMIENTEAYTAGLAAPHIWIDQLNRLFQYVSTCWPILIYMYMSSKKLPQLKPLAVLSTPSMIFCIVEPLMFGLPIVLNPFLAIPFVLIHTITAAVSYLLTSIGFVGRFVISIPWATPSPILAYLATAGSIGAVLLVFINFAIGMVIMYPFWKAYEKNEIKKLEDQKATEVAV